MYLQCVYYLFASALAIIASKVQCTMLFGLECHVSSIYVRIFVNRLPYVYSIFNNNIVVDIKKTEL